MKYQNLYYLVKTLSDNFELVKKQIVLEIFLPSDRLKNFGRDTHGCLE